MKKKLLFLLLTTFLLAEDKTKLLSVKITNTLSSITTKDSGQKVEIRRSQDSQNRLTDDYTKTSRACPPFCIQSTKIATDIKSIAELELLDFIQNHVSKNQGILVDSRLKNWFEVETIPSAINIPYTAIENRSKKKTKRLFQALGMRIKADGSWDFSKAKSLAIFDNGIWCEQAQHFVNGLIQHNYPKDKLFYYRAGFQGWKLLGLTTIVHKEIK
ncbi:MAG: hypothetical protein KAG56_04200 [Sulfurovaceae bacterium]|nr:hypothetical protein [Sulfurovaceae bacterium]